MKRILAPILLLTFLFPSLAYGETMNDLVKRNGIAYKQSLTVPFSGKTKGQSKGSFRNGKKVGPWVWYHKNGQFFNLLDSGLSLKFSEIQRFSGKFSIVSPAYGEQKTQFHLRLVNRLDRPGDGYCLDILGTPNSMRINLPLFAHNCKSTLTPDSAVIFNPSGQIKFPSVNRCITVAGVNSNAVPGASILLRKCDEMLPFFETSALQHFIHRKDGRISIIGSELCLTVGAKSAETYSPYHRWRTLFVEDCTNADASRSKWEFIIPE
jgi:hypothetical protein